MRAHPYQQALAGRSERFGPGGLVVPPMLASETESREHHMQEFEKGKHIMDVIHELQGRFYQKFQKPEDAHRFFDINGDGGVDEREFLDILRYAGCWHGENMGRQIFQTLTLASKSAALSVKDLTDRLLVPTEESQVRRRRILVSTCCS
jgi:Ca2+-binding EF-hand superfamily protein